MTIPVVFRNHFQLGYVVRDIDAAIRVMTEKFGVGKWEVRRPSSKAAPARALGFAYVQQTMIELIDVDPERETIYRDWIPQGDGDIRLHHLGYMIDSEEDWHATVGQFEAAQISAALAGRIGDVLDYYYADTVAQLGHYCELVRLLPAGRDFWANVPQN
jgi:extradiol dioxygenase family protein